MRILGQDFQGILGCDYYAATANTLANAPCWFSSVWRT